MMKGMLTPPAALHAILFASGEPLSKEDIRKLLGLKESELTIATLALTQLLQNSGLALVQTPLELELRTAPEASSIVKKLRESELSRDLGKASIETLAVIAYQEGATRGEVDWMRGVNSSTSLRTLLMRGLILGREDPRDKRRIHYTLTTEALAHLGLTRLEDLPRHAELSLGAHAAIENERTSPTLDPDS